MISLKIEQIVWQDCPVSSSLFILCLEILSNYINTNAMIKGIKINDQEIKQTFFADDATFVNDGSATSFETLVETLHKFRKISGLNLNSTIMRIGSLKNSNFEYCTEKKLT